MLCCAVLSPPCSQRCLASNRRCVLSHPALMPTCTLGSLSPTLLQPLPALLLGLPAGLPQSALRLTGPLLDLALKLRGQSHSAASSDVLLLHIL